MSQQQNPSMANKSRAIVKNCPKCDHSVAVASKSCKNKACGHSFFDAKRTTRSRYSTPETGIKNRSEKPL